MPTGLRGQVHPGRRGGPGPGGGPDLEVGTQAQVSAGEFRTIKVELEYSQKEGTAAQRGLAASLLVPAGAGGLLTRPAAPSHSNRNLQVNLAEAASEAAS